MLIEPTPAIPRSRGGHARRIASASVPVIGLLAVVAAGVLTGGADRPNDTAGLAVEPAAAAAQARADSDRDGLDDRAPRDEAFPTRVLGLPVLDIATARDLRAAGALGDGLIALRGYLTLRPRLTDCLGGPEAPVTVSLCRRDTILSEDPEPLLAREDGVARWIGTRPGQHLHPQAMPGVTLPALDASLDAASGVAATPDGPIRPVASIIIGRFDDPRVAARATGGRHHGEEYALERLVWADGRWQDRGIARSSGRGGDGLDPRDIRTIIDEHLSTGAVILSQSVVDPTGLAPAQAATIRALGGAAPAASPVWYVRTMIRATGPPSMLDAVDVAMRRRVAWLVIGGDGSVLALDRDG
jgi:hypothetical protein